MKTIYLIDSENVGDTWIELLDLVTEQDSILVFYTDHSPNMSYKNLIRLKQSTVQPQFIECENGTENALDFQLTLSLGMYLKTFDDYNFIIVSKDKGFDVVVNYCQKINYNVCRKSPNILFHKSESKTDTPIEETKADNPTPITSTTDMANINESELDTILSCIGKSNLSALHNILVSIYGKECGVQVYNTVKSSSYEVKKVNWQKKTKYRKFLHILFSHAGLPLDDDIAKKLHPQKGNLKNIHNLFISEYGSNKGSEYYSFYKQHSDFLDKTF